MMDGIGKPYAHARREFLDETDSPHVGHTDRARKTTTNILRVIFKRGDHTINTVPLPEYGETRIVTHAGKVTFVEITVKEKVE